MYEVLVFLLCTIRIRGHCHSDQPSDPDLHPEATLLMHCFSFTMPPDICII